MARTSIPAAALAGRAPVIGRRRDGRPIHLIAGADERGSLMAEAQTLRATLETATGADLDAAITRSDEIVARLQEIDAEAEGQRVAAEQAQRRRSEARSRLAGLVPAGAPAGAGTEQRGGFPGLSDEAPSAGVPQQRAEVSPRERLRTALTGHEDFASFRANGFRGSFALEVPGEVRALIDSTTSPVQTTRVPGRVVEPDRPLRFADLIDRRPIGTNSLEYVREVSAESNAAEVAEGAVKPEAAFDLEVITDNVRVIATWVNMTRQSAEDDSTLQGYVEGRLTYGLQRRLDSAIVAGDGVGVNLEGILNVDGIGTYVAPSAEAAIISIRKAMTVAQLSEYFPDTVGMSPVDWERVELSTDDQGMFRVSPNVQVSLTPRIWGLNVVPSTVFSGTTGAVGGRFLVGGFREGATLWERSGIRILLTDSHASNFTSNILTLLAEMRAGLSVWRPSAFVAGTFSANGDGLPGV